MVFFSRKVYKPNKIIDVHAHILYGVDDGARNIEESISLLKLASEEGITHIICTPHYKNGHYNASKETIKKRLEEVQLVSKELNLNINLYGANEILYSEDMISKLDPNTINGTKYVLVEFHPEDEFTYIRNSIEAVLSAGLKPVVAHIERYYCIAGNPSLVHEIKNMGAKVQINASSVSGEVGKQVKKTTLYLIKNDLVDYIGTDMHRPSWRAPELKKCIKILNKNCNESRVEKLLYANAYKDFEL